MSDGVTHFLLGKNLPIPYGIISGMVTYNYTGDLNLSLATGVSTFAGLYLSVRYLGPDCDLPGRTFNERGLIGKIISIITYPFTKLTHHRGITHKPPIGTLIIYSPLWFLLGYLTYFHFIPYQIFAGFFAGAFVGDFWHVMADLDTGLKKLLEEHTKWDYKQEH